MRVLVIDNYDSFTYNLVQYLGELGAELEVVRNDRARSTSCSRARPTASSSRRDRARPNEAGISLEAVRRFPQAGIPTLGVCLGHQALAQAFGGSVVRHQPVHGKTGVDRARRRARSTAACLSPLTVGPLPLADRRRSSFPTASR